MLSEGKYGEALKTVVEEVGLSVSQYSEPEVAEAVMEAAEAPAVHEFVDVAPPQPNFVTMFDNPPSVTKVKSQVDVVDMLPAPTQATVEVTDLPDVAPGAQRAAATLPSAASKKRRVSKLLQEREARKARAQASNGSTLWQAIFGTRTKSQATTKFVPLSESPTSLTEATLQVHPVQATVDHEYMKAVRKGAVSENAAYVAFPYLLPGETVVETAAAAAVPVVVADIPDVTPAAQPTAPVTSKKASKAGSISASKGGSIRASRRASRKASRKAAKEAAMEASKKASKTASKSRRVSKLQQEREARKARGQSSKGSTLWQAIFGTRAKSQATPEFVTVPEKHTSLTESTPEVEVVEILPESVQVTVEREYVKVVRQGAVSENPPSVSRPYVVPLETTAAAETDITTAETVLEDAELPDTLAVPVETVAVVTADVSVLEVADLPDVAPAVDTEPDAEATVFPEENAAQAIVAADVPVLEVADLPDATPAPATQPAAATHTASKMRTVSKLRQKREERELRNHDSQGSTLWLIIPVSVFAALFGFSAWNERYIQKQTAKVAEKLRKMQMDYKVCSGGKIRTISPDSPFMNNGPCFILAI